MDVRIFHSYAPAYKKRSLNSLRKEPERVNSMVFELPLWFYCSWTIFELVEVTEDRSSMLSAEWCSVGLVPITISFHTEGSYSNHLWVPSHQAVNGRTASTGNTHSLPTHTHSLPRRNNPLATVISVLMASEKELNISGQHWERPALVYCVYILYW